jgi:hypothetical protein
LLLLFDFLDFFDKLRASSSWIANSSLAFSSSSLVLLRPLSGNSDGSIIGSSFGVNGDTKAGSTFDTFTGG